MLDRSTSSSASVGSHGFTTTRFPRKDHGLCLQIRRRSFSFSRRNTKVFWPRVLMWVLGGIFQAFVRVDLTALVLRGLSERIFAIMGKRLFKFGSSIWGVSS
ncbi:hypothetical protein Salat_1487700 [Sesamum alatum]|uniref:Uncharacterized protein n=1 Tax=Sesamum alatum TaxID=300844 RepID=A0AAE2CM41_9LAMI|nr:hypothetical protein Salat_1487700 [Sesamum alatum]